MRLNTLEKLYLCMRNRTPEVKVPEEIASAHGTPGADAGVELRQPGPPQGWLRRPRGD